jgi:signal transduction histidine kinase
MDSPFATSFKHNPAGMAADMHWAFEQSPDCIKIMACTGELMAMNINGQCALEIDDFSAVLGTHWPRMWPEAARADVHAAIDAAGAGDAAHFNAFCPTAKGTPRWWDVVVTPIRDGEGTVRSLLAVSRDVTGAHHAVQERLQLAARLEATMDAAGFGEWDMDLVTGSAACGARHGQCFGYAGAVPDWSAARMLAHLHPDDQARVSAMLDAAQPGADIRFECRVIWPDTSVHWISAQGSRRACAGQNDRLVGLVCDITERMQKNEALQEASRKKEEFLAMLAHELRNPLAPICAAAQVLTGGCAEVAQQAKAGAIIERQARHMTHLLDDLLDVARVTQGLITLDMARVDLVDVVNAALEQSRPMVAQYGHHVAVTLAPGPVAVSGDSQRLVQVVVTLLNNAAKYTPAGGSMALSLTVAAGSARIGVCDNGIGMAPATLQNAFDLFSQAARASDRADGGLGLGLALVKGLVERHGGSVAGHSDGPNCGSEFVVLLPLLEGEQPPAAPEPAAAPCAAAGRLCLLIVDDNVDAAETLAMYLEMLGHATHVAFSGRAAIELAAHLALDACLLDVGLPDMSGHELARRLAALPAMHGTTLIAITGYGSASDRAESAEAGFHHHLTKPVDTHLLEQLLDGIGAVAA